MLGAYGSTLADLYKYEENGGLRGHLSFLSRLNCVERLAPWNLDLDHPRPTVS